MHESVWQMISDGWLALTSRHGMVRFAVPSRAESHECTMVATSATGSMLCARPTTCLSHQSPHLSCFLQTRAMQKNTCKMHTTSEKPPIEKRSQKSTWTTCYKHLLKFAALPAVYSARCAQACTLKITVLSARLSSLRHTLPSHNMVIT